MTKKTNKYLIDELLEKFNETIIYSIELKYEQEEHVRKSLNVCKPGFTGGVL